MKKIVSATLVLVMVLSMSVLAFAATDTSNFVPSIGAKPAPTVITAELFEDGKKIEDIDEHCLLITPVSDAANDKEDPRLPAAAKSLLLDVYGKLNDNTMKLPSNYLEKAGLNPNRIIIRELVDISWVCKEISPTHAEKMVKDGVQLKVKFQMSGLQADEKISVMCYKNNQWTPIAEVINNGDETVTCTFDHLCPVVFVVDSKAGPGTGVEFDSSLFLWVGIMVVSSVALVVVVTKRRQNVA